MSPRSVVVTGANRGIGLGLVHQLLKDSHIQIIIATARDVEKATELHAIQDSRLHILPLTVTCDKSIDNLVSKVGEIVGEDGLNLLINNAGIMLKYSSKKEANRALLTEQLNVNTISVVLISQKFIPLLSKAASKHSDKGLSISRAAVVNISSRFGSITENCKEWSEMETVSYCMSKAALNMFTKSFSFDVANDHILAASFTPGWVQTDMGGQEAALTIEQSTSSLVESFRKLNDSHNGGFFDKDLTTIGF